MCLILFAFNVHPAYRLVLAANRDEFYDRPSQAADFWTKHPQVLAGVDLKEKGTWLGVTKTGKFAAITNYRDPSSWKADAPSRGKLVSRYLTGLAGADQYLKKLSANAGCYNGFNLLLGDGKDLLVYSNRGSAQKIPDGIHGLSNHLLDTPWPKIQRGKALLKKALAKKGDELEDALFALLTDRSTPPDRELPDTGVGLPWERVLSPMFIASSGYGTRSSTVLFIGKNGRIKLTEKIYNGGPELWLTSRFSFLRDK
jgi:uncharacterized protein with NRDE domain